MRHNPGSPGARILAVGEHRASRLVSNDEICQYIDSSDEWIRERSGIVSRRFVGSGETVVTMGADAAAKAVAAAGIGADDVDLVLVATCSHPYQLPAAASEVQHLIGATNAGATDVQAACSGFPYALSMAADVVRAGSARHVVVVGSEVMSSVIDLHDRGTSFLFGDGAGAVVVGPSDHPGIGPVVWGSDGSQAGVLGQQPSYLELKEAIASGGEVTIPTLHMAGPTVFRWAVTAMGPIAQAALDAAGVRADELGAFIPHQANVRIIDAIAKAIKLPASVPVARDMATQGNTSGASIPLAMSAMLERGEIESGRLALLIGFGSGLAYAAQVVEIP